MVFLDNFWNYVMINELKTHGTKNNITHFTIIVNILYLHIFIVSFKESFREISRLLIMINRYYTIIDFMIKKQISLKLSNPLRKTLK